MNTPNTIAVAATLALLLVAAFNPSPPQDETDIYDALVAGHESVGIPLVSLAGGPNVYYASVWKRHGATHAVITPVTVNPDEPGVDHAALAATLHGLAVVHLNARLHVPVVKDALKGVPPGD